MKLLFPLCAAVLVFSPYHAKADNQKKTLQERIPREVLDKKDSFFSVTVENDLFGKGTDQNYTHGTRLTYFDMGAEPPGFAKLLDRWVPTFEVNETTSVYYSVGQNLYTPEDIEARIPDPNDRPYAGFLYGAAGFISVTDNHIDDVEITLGVVGPSALGGETQEFVHDVIDADDPSGWDYQLKNELGFILSWQRRWPEAFADEIGPFYFRTTPHVGISLGNVYTYAASGLSFQLTPKQYKWQSQPLRVRPAIPGSGFFHVPEERFAWSLFAGVEGRLVGRNIFLDGNTFEDSPSVDKKYFVADANAGVSFTYGRAQLSYTLNYRTREFDGQEDESLFGAISLGYRY